MPFVRISLPEHLSAASKRATSQAIHTSLIEEFNIPQDDYFHVIEELKPTQLLYPENYLGIAHTANIVYVQIFTGRTPEQKKRIVFKNCLKKILVSDVIIVLIENKGRENCFRKWRNSRA